MDIKHSIAVTPEIFESLEKIMHSGARGVHLLFSNHMIREAFNRSSVLDLLSDRKLAQQLQETLTYLFEIDGLEERQEYIELLDSHIRDILVHLYFGFLDRYIHEGDEEILSPEVLH